MFGLVCVSSSRNLNSVLLKLLISIYYIVMSERRKILIVFFLGFFQWVECHSDCTISYGVEICKFLPAPPGKTPPCAKPGLTYCEHPDHYPSQRIDYLVEKWNFNHRTLLVDESKDDFSAHKSYPYPAPTYGPYHYGPNTLKQDSYYPEPIYIPKPPYTFDTSTRVGNAYIPPYPTNNHTFGDYPNRRPTEAQFVNFKYSNNIPPLGLGSESYPVASSFYPSSSLPITANPYVKVWSRKDDRFGKALLIRKKRSDKIRNNLKYLRSTYESFSNGTTFNGRHKRQSALTGQTLCETRSQFIMPRAALNNKGNWMYVVNMPETDNKLSQLVKSETCLSQTCSGLCSLPIGYTSKCEQKYVQKRLVALEGGGNELYTDVFWFPSCCVCTISNG